MKNKAPRCGKALGQHVRGSSLVKRIPSEWLLSKELSYRKP